MADRILADPSRRKLFEKDTMYNLLELPARCKHSPTMNRSSAKRITDTSSDSELEEGQLSHRTKKLSREKHVKVLTEKKIRKNKKFQDFENQQT